MNPTTEYIELRQSGRIAAEELTCILNWEHNGGKTEAEKAQED
jgi:hypothetical protein